MCWPLAPADPLLPRRGEPAAPTAGDARQVGRLSRRSDRGRVELGLGSGGFGRPPRRWGASPGPAGEAVAALSEAIDVIRHVEGRGGARYAGRYYRLDGVNPGPVPAHAVAIWLGVNGPRMLQLVGQKADGWVPSSGYVPPPQLPERQRRIDDAAAAAGRDPRANLACLQRDGSHHRRALRRPVRRAGRNGGWTR